MSKGAYWFENPKGRSRKKIKEKQRKIGTMSLELHDNLILLKRRYVGNHVSRIAIKNGYKYSLEEQGRTNILYSTKANIWLGLAK